MPIIKSAKKRVRTAHKAATRNSRTKRNLKSALKIFYNSPSSKAHSEAQSHLDIAVKKGIIHKNKAARLKRRASARAKAANIKLTRASTNKSAQPKKAAVKKAPAKKSTTKNSVSKKK